MNATVGHDVLRRATLEAQQLVRPVARAAYEAGKAVMTPEGDHAPFTDVEHACTDRINALLDWLRWPELDAPPVPYADLRRD
jgi:hypothetical protein